MLALESYLASMTPRDAGSAKMALARLVRADDGRVCSRRELVEDRFRNGWRVRGERFASEAGVFFDVECIGVQAMRYALFLTKYDLSGKGWISLP